MADPGSNHWTAASIYPVCRNPVKNKTGKDGYGEKRENRQGKGILWFHDRICGCTSYDFDAAAIYVAVCSALHSAAFGISGLSAYKNRLCKLYKAGCTCIWCFDCAIPGRGLEDEDRAALAGWQPCYIGCDSSLFPSAMWSATDWQAVYQNEAGKISADSVADWLSFFCTFSLSI